MEKCFFYARTDKNGWPIPGTMMSYDHPICNCHTTQLVPTAPLLGLVNGVNYTQIFHPKGLRYFVRTTCENGIIGVMPNSLFISKKNPGGNTVEWYNTWTS
jgi:hypothetical protein